MTTAERFNRAKRAILEREYGHLNDMQREAVFYTSGPLLILAGAGSGKTTVIVNRVAYLLRYGDAYHAETRAPSEKDAAFLEDCLANPSPDKAERVRALIADRPAPPWSILAITFTNKAATEMKERIRAMAPDCAEDIWASTFHSMCARILRRDIERLGYRRDFTIYDADDSERLVKSCAKELDIDSNLPPQALARIISRAKDRLLMPEEFAAAVGSDVRMRMAARVYRLYQEKLRAANALDFDDLILQTVRLFRRSEEVLDYYRRRFKYILVDEYQDTNIAQYKLVSLLAGSEGRLCVVGDDDQSIYRFRGATIENILRFEEQFKGARVIRLEQNYRSTQHILDAANAVISHNTGRKGKTLWTANGSGERVRLYRALQQDDEGLYIARNIERLMLEEGFGYGDFAVLYRTNAQSRAIENVLRLKGIPARVIGGTGFYQRKEVKDMLAYLSVLANPADTLRLRRIINEPKRGIGAATLALMDNIAEEEGVTLYEAMRRAEQFPAVSRPAAKRLSEFVSMMDELRELSRSLPLNELYREVADRSGYTDALRAMGAEGEDKLELVEELSSAIVLYMEAAAEPTLAGFLEEMALISAADEYDEDAPRVSLMTIHTAKGLEFPVVFLSGMEEGLFPSGHASSLPDELEEERRLAYVGITRAKRHLFLSYAERRMLYGNTVYSQMSRFIKEIPAECIKAENGPPPAAGPASFAGASSFLTGQAGSARRRGGGAAGGGVAQKTPQSAGAAFKKGDRVLHRVFGPGMVLTVTPMGNDTLLEIIFDKAGTKKIMANFAGLRPEA